MDATPDDAPHTTPGETPGPPASTRRDAAYASSEAAPHTTPQDAAHVPPEAASDATPQDAAHVFSAPASDITPEEAARTLREIRESQARVIRARPWFPPWYTTGVALFVTGMQVLTEPGTPGAVTATGIVVLTLALAGSVGAVVLFERQRPHRSLITASALVSFMAWVAVCVGLCLAVALSLSGAGVPYARTYAGLAMTAFMAVTGPLVGRWITRRIAAAVEAG
ncbi:hypothetical protein ABZU32_30510 [Sphaerisporangium sp. NPDC005288]|uniref:hypothetical protein n=1 Tax=Sphaerisporangium sp. NPDC005288 TaxID=3155114 RepID=UPI0033A7264D